MSIKELKKLSNDRMAKLILSIGFIDLVYKTEK